VRWELRADAATGKAALVKVVEPVATGIRPADAPNLPAVQSQWELRPRIFVSVIDPAMANKGRVVFRDLPTSQGSIPILADTRALIAVGAANWSGQPQPYSATGTPGTLWNFLKPNVLAYDGLALTPPGTGSAYGTSLATPFAAGTAAALISAGFKPHQIQAHLLKCPPMVGPQH
jgi:subtilisin family serine protease